MALIDVLSLDGTKVGQIELNDQLFAGPVKEHLLWEVVTAQRAAARRGCASTKGRSDVRGSTRKLQRQKGTGRARHGAARAPTAVGGGVAFGPHPRNYEKRVPKKVRRAALVSAVSMRAADKRLIVIKDFALGEYKTQRMAALLKALGTPGGLFVEAPDNAHLIGSVRNLRHSKYIAPAGVNVYDILKYPTLIVSEPAIRQLEERLAS